MNANIDYAEVTNFLRKYYEKEYEGYDVSFELKKNKRTGQCHGWFEGDTYEYNEMYGMVSIKRRFNGEWNSKRLSFSVDDSIYVSEGELERIIISLFNESLGDEPFKAISVYPGDEYLVVSLEKTNVKKLVLAKNS